MSLEWRSIKWDVLGCTWIAYGPRREFTYTVDTKPRSDATLTIKTTAGHEVEKRRFPDVHLAKTMAYMWEKNKYHKILATIHEMK